MGEGRYAAFSDAAAGTCHASLASASGASPAAPSLEADVAASLGATGDA